MSAVAECPYCAPDEPCAVCLGLTAAAWDPVKHPRHPKGSEAGGEFAPKSTFVGLQGYERGPGKVVIEGERPRTPTSEVFAHPYQELGAAVTDWAHLRELDPDKELVSVSELVPTQDQMSAVRIQEYVTELREDGNLEELLDSTRVVEGDDGRLYIADGHNRVAAGVELGYDPLPLPVIRQAKALAAAAAEPEELTVEQFNEAVEAAAGSLDRFEPKLTRIYERAMKELGRQLAARFVRLAPDAVAAAGYVEAQHPRDPGGEGGGQWVAKGMPRALDKGELAGFPPGVIEPGASTMFWPKEIGSRNGQPFWKALVDRDGTERAFWFADERGFPHHAAVRVLQGELDEKLLEVGGYGNRDIWIQPQGQALRRRMTPKDFDMGLALVQRHARDIRDAGDMLHNLAAAATPPADWTPPTVAELLAVQEDILEQAAAEARTVQIAAFEAMVDGVLRRIGISFEVRAILTQALLNGLGARAIEMIEGIRVPVARAIANSYLNGLSVPQTADVIQEAVDGLTKRQATMLARNDLIGLANGGSLTSARLVREKFPDVGLAYKEWLATPDERTRPTHVEAHGQRVPLETPFTVGEAHLAYPGDPTGPDAEVINCRCTLIYKAEPALTASSVVEKIQELTAAFIESQHPRDPGGDKGGEFVKKGTTGVDEGEGETELREAEGATLQEMLDDMGAYELEGGQERHPERYMKHPKSGFMVEKPGTVYPEAVSPELDEDGWGRKPPRIRDVVASEAFKRPEGFTDEQALGYGKWQVGEARPPEYLFRAISEEEWEGIQRRGYMQTDGRMNLSEMEGTVTALSDPSYYLPGALSSDKAGTYEGRVIRIRYHDEDGWRHDRDGYVKTSSAVPIDRIDMVTPKLKREVTPRPGKDWNDIGPVVRASAAWDEAKHPRDPGGEGGGRWIPKGTTAPGAIDSDYNPEAVGATNRLGFYLLDEANALRQAAKAVGEYASVDVLLKEKVMRDLDVALAHDPDWEALSRKVNRLEMKDYSASPGENAAARLIASWATTSSDADPWALQLQLAAEQEFGLTDVSDYARKAWDAEKTGMMAFPLSEALRDPWVEHYVWNEQEMAGARKFLRAQYDATQKVLADADINTVALYRGVRDIGAAHGQSREKMTLNPLSSFSTRYDTAYAFAVSGMGAGEDWKDASLIAMNVPRERILSFPLTGFGSEMEQEAVVLGGTEEGFRWTWHKQLRRPPGEPLTLMDPQDVGRPPFDHSKYLQAWDKA